LVAEPRIDPAVLEGVVAVGDRVEERIQQQHVRAEGDEVVEPAGEPAQAVDDVLPAGPAVALAAAVLAVPRRTAEAQRVDLPADRIADPGGSGRVSGHGSS